MSQIIYAVANDGVISAFVNGRLITIAADHRYRKEALKALKEQDGTAFVQAANMSHKVNDYLSPSGKLSVKDGAVCYRNIPIEFPFTKRLLEMMEEGLPFEPFVRYIERTMKNPRPRCVATLDILVNKRGAAYPLPILPDGRILAYKRVMDDYLDFHSRTVKYEPLEVKYKDDHRATNLDWLHAQKGNEVGMPIWEVDDNYQLECSRGFHAGLFEYVNTFHKGQGHVIAVAVCPSQVISVPDDARAMKFRTHQLEVRHTITEEQLGLVFDPTGVIAAERASTTWYGNEIAANSEDDEIEDEDDWSDVVEDDEDDYDDF